MEQVRLSLLLVASQAALRGRLSDQLASRGDVERVHAVSTLGDAVDLSSSASFDLSVYVIDDFDIVSAQRFCEWSRSTWRSDLTRCVVVSPLELKNSWSSLYAAGSDACISLTGDLMGELGCQVVAGCSARSAECGVVDGPEGLELSAGGMSVRLKGRELQLTPSQFRVLSHLARNHNRIVPKQELAALARLEPEASAGSDGALYECLSQIRKKLGSQRDLLLTIRGHGYRLASRVES